jgi:WD40 repeat protein
VTTPRPPASGPLADAIAEFLQAVDRGEAPDRTAILAAHPELAAELAAFFDDFDRMNRLAAPLRLSDPAATTGLDGAPAGGPPVVRYFGDYELLEEIARGGMGVVYRARQVSLNRPVALKMILAGQFASPADVGRFRLEAEAAANLDHPNVLPLYEVGEHDGRQYFSMKLVEGGSLADRLRAKAPVPTAELVRLLSRVARAVHFAHQRGILHRDLKPANVLIDRDGTPYVTDFGLAKRVESDSGLTQSGAVLGTPSSMAPEQARAERQLTTAVDVYALGAILYEVLTGRPPFRAASVYETVRQVIERDPEHPRVVNPNADRDLSVVAMKCLEKDPGKRYESAAALADDLDRWLDGVPIAARPAGSFERVRKWAGRNPAVAALLLCVAVAMIATALSGVIAVQQAVVARQREEDALHALDSATKAQAAETVHRRAAEAALYRARLAVAHAAWQGNEVWRARQTLGECPPETRGWEWHYLRRLCETGLLTLGADRGTFRCVNFSPDGRHLAGGAADAVVVWEVKTGKEVNVLPGTPDRGPTTCVKFSPDGKLLVAGRGPAVHFDARNGGTTQINGPSELVAWDWPAGTERFRFPLDGPTGPFIFTKDGRHLVVPGFKTKGGSSEVAVLDALTGKEVAQLKDAGHLPALAGDGKTLYVGQWNGITAWDTATWAAKPELKLGAARLLAADPFSGLLATVELSSGAAVLFDQAGQTVARLDAHSGPVQALAFDENGYLVAGGLDGRVRVWFADKEARLLNTFNGHSWPVTGVAATMRAPSRRVATAGGEVKLWHPEQGQEGSSPGLLFNTIARPVLSPSGRLAITWNGPTLVAAGLDPATDAGGDQRLTFEQSTHQQAAVGWDGEDMLALFKSGDGKPARVWNVRTQKEVAALEVKIPALAQVDFRPAAGLVAVFGKDDPADPKAPPGGTLSVSNTRTGKALWSARLARNAGVVALSPAADRLLVPELGPRSVTRSMGWGVTSSTPIADECTVYDARTGGVLWSVKGSIWQAEFAARGAVLLQTGAGERVDRLASHDAATGVEQWSLPLPGEPRVLITSHDGGLFAYADDRPGGMEGMEVRSLVTGEVVAVLPRERASSSMFIPAAVSFTPDGSRLAVGRSDGSIRVWDPRAGAELLTLRGHKGAVASLVFTAEGRKLISVARDEAARVWDATPTAEP